MITTEKINPQKVKLALSREGYVNIEEFAQKAGMSHGTITKALSNGECTYKTAFKLADNLGINADDFVVNE